MPNNAKKSVYKEKEFQTYALWKSLPSHIRGLKKEQLELYGFTDPLIISISKIKNQTEFAKFFHIKDLGTLTDWNNKIKENELSNIQSNSDTLATSAPTSTPSGPIATLHNVLKEQLDHVDKKISSGPNSILEKRIDRLEKLISKLKSENESYRRILIRKDIVVRKNNLRPVSRSVEKSAPAIYPNPNFESQNKIEESETLSSKFKRLFSW